ncbi:hypothetical protein Pa4123_29230, partial [Phytohabitans aurantiacus]
RGAGTCPTSSVRLEAVVCHVPAPRTDVGGLRPGVKGDGVTRFTWARVCEGSGKYVTLAL